MAGRGRGPWWLCRSRRSVRPRSCGSWRGGSGTGGSALGCSPWPTPWTGWVGGRRRGPRAWTGRRCGTGSTATTPRASRACATGRARGAGVARALAEVSTGAMTLFLAELARVVPPGTHAVLVLDRAGWHVSGDLIVPANLTLVHLPPYSPELNPVERVWRYLRERWLSH